MLKVVFFKTLNGKEPVRDWLLNNVTKEERTIIGQDIMTVQYGWPMGMPLVRPLGNGLWEVRSNLPNRTARIFFFTTDNYIVLVHSFIKKTQKTPQKELDIARNRMQDFLAG